MSGASNLVEVGDVVEVSTEDRKKVNALVVTVHGTGYEIDGVFCQPSINCVYVSPDPSKHDSYGTQVERLSSLQHYNSGPDKMPNPGRFWKFPS
jgi:hypothetical protein